MRTRVFICVTATFGASACIPTISDDVATVQKPRLVAVAATPAEAVPGANVALSALVAMPPGTTRPGVDWELCVERKPLTELGSVSPDCLHPGETDGAVSDPIGRGYAVATAVPRQACSLFGPNPPPPKAGETGGRPADPDPTGGYYQPVIAFLAGAPTLGSIRLSCGVAGLTPDQTTEFGNRYRINENPRIATLRLGAGTVVPESGMGDAPAVRRGATVTLTSEWAACPRKSVCGDGICGEREDASSCPDDCPSGASKGCTGAETYAWFDSTANEIVDRREAITVTWYSTAGDFSERLVGVAESDPDTPRTQTSWTAPKTAGEQTLWAVIRDDRGGASWTAYTLHVE